MIVTFFGHRDTPFSIKDNLKSLLTDLINEYDNLTFYIGNNGNFDNLVLQELNELSKTFNHFDHFLILAYLPLNSVDLHFNNTIYPEGLEKVPRQFAISKRNEWMVKKADIVITYVSRNFGGASKYKLLAKRKKKVIIELFNESQEFKD